MGQRAAPAPFLMKTYELVDDKRIDDVISWGEKGTTFVVWKTAEFAKDLLPSYFKHNNFSSFVRQLNTYGFRKIVPDKWEFANDNFKRGQKELLTEIRRRKTNTQAAGDGGKSGPSNVSSGEEAGSSSTSSPGSKHQASTVEIADISGENEKLRKDNELLSSELAQARQQCEELMCFLTGYLKVGPDQINHIIRATSGSPLDRVVGDEDLGYDHNDDDDDDDDDKGEEDCSSSSRMKKKLEDEGGLKLFGVWLKEGKKRGRCCDGTDGQLGFSGSQAHQRVKAMKIN